MSKNLEVAKEYGGELQNAFPIGTALHRAVVNAISNTQATAEAYDREHAAKVLEDADVCPDCYRKKAHSVPDIMNGACEKWYAVRDPEARIECNKLAELRAANKKGGE